MVVGVASTEHRPISLFSEFAPEDVSLHEQLEKHLSSLKRQGLISLWSVDKTLAGADRKVEIERHFNAAQIILLLLSADFFDSEHCNDVMMRALQRQKEDHIRVIPILLRAVDWENSPISRLQTLPSNGNFVTQWPNSDDAFSHIAKEIRKIVAALLNLPADIMPITEITFTGSSSALPFSIYEVSPQHSDFLR